MLNSIGKSSHRLRQSVQRARARLFCRLCPTARSTNETGYALYCASNDERPPPNRNVMVFCLFGRKREREREREAFLLPRCVSSSSSSSSFFLSFFLSGLSFKSEEKERKLMNSVTSCATPPPPHLPFEPRCRREHGTFDGRETTPAKSGGDDGVEEEDLKKKKKTATPTRKRKR